jgi:hypothetical protein
VFRWFNKTIKGGVARILTVARTIDKWLLLA